MLLLLYFVLVMFFNSWHKNLVSAVVYWYSVIADSLSLHWFFNLSRSSFMVICGFIVIAWEKACNTEKMIYKTLSHKVRSYYLKLEYLAVTEKNNPIPI